MDAPLSNFLVQCLGQGVRDVPDRCRFLPFWEATTSAGSVADHPELEQQLAARAALLS